MQVRQPFYNSLLAGTIPVTFDSQLLQILPFQEHMHWQNITVQVNPENIASHNAHIADILKVRDRKIRFYLAVVVPLKHLPLLDTFLT